MKSKLHADFRKKKAAIGRAKQAPINKTNTNFKSFKIAVPTQLIDNHKDITLILSNLASHNEPTRLEAMPALKDLFTRDKAVFLGSLGTVINAISRASLDDVLL